MGRIPMSSQMRNKHSQHQRAWWPAGLNEKTLPMQVINAFANWFRPFFENGWCVWAAPRALFLILVACSLLSNSRALYLFETRHTVARGKEHLRVLKPQVATHIVRLPYLPMSDIERQTNITQFWFKSWKTWSCRSLLDAFIVITSLVTVSSTGHPTGSVRALRSIRVIRLFGRIK